MWKAPEMIVRCMNALPASSGHRFCGNAILSIRCAVEIVELMRLYFFRLRHFCCSLLRKPLRQLYFHITKTYQFSRVLTLCRDHTCHLISCSLPVCERVMQIHNPPHSAREGNCCSNASLIDFRMLSFSSSCLAYNSG